MKRKSKNVKCKSWQLAFAVCFCVFSFTFLVSPASAQPPDQVDTAPPPLRMLTKEERTSLESTNDVKARTKLALEYMTTHVSAAEAYNEKREYDAMFHELGGFHGLIDHTLLFLTKSDRTSNRVLDNLKRFEIGLRGFMPRLEGIHRELPFRYEDYVRKLIAYVRNARTKALDPLFSDSVIKKSDQIR